MSGVEDISGWHDWRPNYETMEWVCRKCDAVYEGYPVISPTFAPQSIYQLPCERNILMEPVNCTHMHISWYDDATDTGGTIHEDVFYKCHPNYEHMPRVTQAPETKQEHAAWWAWYREVGG